MYNTYNIQNIFNWLLMLSVRLLVNSRLLVVKFWQSQKLYVDFWLHGHGGKSWEAMFGSPTPHVVPRSTVLYLGMWQERETHLRSSIYKGAWLSDSNSETSIVLDAPIFPLIKSSRTGAPGWLSQLNVRLLISAQVMISGSWDGVPSSLGMELA